jgi:tetratricopeptide (TPR) repeat protein
MSTMEASRSSSPEPDQIQKISYEKSDCRWSPTTVFDVDDLYLTKDSASNVVSVDNDDALSLDFCDTNYKHLSEQYSESFTSSKKERRSRLRKKQRERKKYLNILPTIQEVSEEEEKEGEVANLGFALLSEEDDISMHIQTLSPPTVTSENEVKEVHLLIEAASQRAAQGNEEKALAICKDGLGVLQQKVARISKQMEAWAMREPKFEKTALYIILHEEWAESALVVADIRMMMASIYERHEDYNEALCCSEGARVIYQRQAIFDERHHKKGSCTREKETSAESMMEQIEEARESQYIRKSLHQTVERIREKIVATKDVTSRGFLYEDIFDKLSTVLSLELMYLGESHPQISNTKGLLSMFYSEIKQNEKALRAMNDAVLICEMALGDKHPQTGTKYQDAAKLYERIGGEDNFSKAIDCYEKAITTLEKAEGNVSERLCFSLNRVAILYIERKCYDIAIKKLKSAIHISEENYRERSDDISTEPIQLWLNLGECQALKGKPALATAASRNALRIQRDKRKFYDASRTGPGSIPDLISNSKIASTMKRLGQSLATELKFKQAYGCFMEALSILQDDLNTAQELEMFNPTTDIPKLEDEVASALYDLAKVKQEDDKYAEATKLYKESLELRKESDKKRTVSERSNHINCARCLAGIGTIELIQNEDSEAFKSFNQAIYYAKQEGIPDSDPIALMLREKSCTAANNMNKGQKPLVGIETENTEQDDVIISQLEEKAKTLRFSKDLENCSKTINIVISMKRALLEKVTGEEQITKAKRQLAASLTTKGEVVLFQNAKNEAIECINEASDLLEQCNLNQNDQNFQQIEKLHDKIRKMKQRNMISDKIRKMKRRSESRAEF